MTLKNTLSGIDLLPYQREPAQRLLKVLLARNCAIDASDMGTGKTYVSAWVAQQIGLPVLVVCPLAVKTSWATVLAQSGTPFRVVNYEQLNPRAKAHTQYGYWSRRGRSEQWHWTLDQKHLIIFDEVHRAGGLNTRASKIVRTRSGNHPALLLSATLARSPLVMKAICARTGICKPENHYTWSRQYGAVVSRWGRALEWPAGGVHREGTQIYRAARRAEQKLKELHAKLYNGDLPYGIRIRKSELKDFPENNILTELVNVSLYKKDEKLQQAYNEVDEEGAISALELTMRKRQKAELSKVPMMVDETKDLIREGHSVVIFCNFVETLNQLERLFWNKIKHSTIRGNQNEGNRNQQIKEFQEDQVHLCLVQIQAGGVGVSLHATGDRRPRVSIVSPTYNAVDLVQSLGRIHRANATGAVTQKIIFAEGSIEEEVYESVTKKIKCIDTLNDGDLYSSPLADNNLRRHQQNKTGDEMNKTETLTNLAKKESKAFRPRARKTRKARVCPCGTEISKGEEFFSFPEKALEKDIQISTCSVECLRKWHKAKNSGVETVTAEHLETKPQDYFVEAWGTDPWEGHQGPFEVTKKYLIDLATAVSGPKDESFIDESLQKVFGYDPYEGMSSVGISQEHALALVEAFGKKKIARENPATVVHDGDGVLRDVKPEKKEEPAHHKFGPSSLAYRETCPGWKNRGGTSQAAERGSICHLACELSEDFVEFPRKFEYEGRQVELDKWECYDVESALNGVRLLISSLGLENGTVHKERKVDVCDGLTFGTADVLIDAGDTLLVADYKFGIHEVAPAEVNPQGLAYAIGAAQLYPEATSITIAFIQPKSGTIDYHTFDREHLLGSASTRIQTIIMRANAYENGELDESQLNATDSCQYCARIGTCPEVAKHALIAGNTYALEVQQSSSVADPSKFETPEQFASALQLASILEEWAPKVKSAAKEAALERGMNIPGYEIAYRKTPRTVKELAAVYKLAVNEFNVDAQQLLDACRVGLGDLQKLVKAGASRGDKALALEKFEDLLEEEGYLKGGDVEVPTLRKLRKRNN